MNITLRDAGIDLICIRGVSIKNLFNGSTKEEGLCSREELPEMPDLWNFCYVFASLGALNSFMKLRFLVILKPNHKLKLAFFKRIHVQLLIFFVVSFKLPFSVVSATVGFKHYDEN